MRQQELHLLSASPEILENASAKFLYRIGARPTGLGGIEGAWNGDYLVDQRLALEKGEYVRVGELSAESPEEELGSYYSYRRSDSALKSAQHQPEALPEIKAKFSDLEPEWKRPQRKK